VTQDAFREALARWASGVTVVATSLEGRLFGLTASSFTSVSMTPPLILVCIDLRSESCEALRRSGAFGVSVLAAGQQEQALRMARPGEDKFEGLAFRSGAGLGQPLLEGALAHLECHTFRAEEAGDHLLLLGEVCEAGVQDREPLLYFLRRFRGLA
jgi:flavin reductase (DIM6/NTAB) family NADH-FMN oxidoreductase RutF